MKKTILSLVTLGLAAVSSFAQGTIAVYNISSSYANNTSATTYTSSLDGVYSSSGTTTASTANSFYYALLVQSYSAATTTINPLDGNYTLGMTATNYLSGGIKGTGAGSGSAVANWGAPTGSTYNTGTQDTYILVGWSASLGTTWSQVEAELTSGNWLAAGYFGTSALGNGYSGGGPNSLVAPNVFGTGVNSGGLTSGLTMYAVPTPEPTTMALAGLGITGLLALRRKK